MPGEVLINATPITKKSLADSVYHYLVEAILTGKLPDGTELSEVAIAAQLGVSRTPVHEAIRHLILDGLIEVLPNRAVQVAQFSPEDIAEVHEMHLLLEPAAAERAALRLPAEKLTKFRETADKLDRSYGKNGWLEQALDFDVHFHDQLAAACGNSRLQAEIAKYRRLARVFCRMIDNLPKLRTAFREHLPILEALERRDPPQARRAMETHIKARMEGVLEIHAHPR